jgi:hypothetical protein
MYSLYRNEYRNFKLAGATMRRRLGRTERTERGESIGAVIHIGMGRKQGNSLCSYLYLKLTKCHIFLFAFYVFSFKNQRTGGWNRFCLGQEKG